MNSKLTFIPIVNHISLSEHHLCAPKMLILGLSLNYLGQEMID
jgi:hypothetical protein